MKCDASSFLNHIAEFLDQLRMVKGEPYPKSIYSRGKDVEVDSVECHRMDLWQRCRDNE